MMKYIPKFKTFVRHASGNTMVEETLEPRFAVRCISSRQPPPLSNIRWVDPARLDRALACQGAN